MEYNPYTLTKCLHTLEEHPECIICLAISSDGQILVSSCYEVIRVWDLSKGELICQSKHLHKYTIGFRLIVNPDLETFITDYNGCIEISDLLTGESFKRFQVRYSAALAISPDGKTLFVGGSIEDDNTISVWDLSAGKLIDTLKGHTYKVNFLIISPDGKTLISQVHNYETKVWNLLTYQEIPTFNIPPRQFIDSAAINSDAKLIVCGSRDSSVKIWDLITNQIIKSFDIKYTVSRFPESILTTMTPDGKILVCADRENMKVWDIENGEEFCTLKGHSSEIRRVSISPDGLKIVSWSENGCMKVWGLS
ncbi:WD40 repeat domain-containing protein [Rivularia sp. UHCC 0363]|uniref:WD40 repeat domain-containing protein n=1 Tax=Rivularia sp. UHCC 0363 TaxID=3110244 RepID=UPI002B1F6BEE|nr:WD40 repeat domain-containing protein [Rivularia sp. UHCC 0363]MEA5593671.1 WD40 repeat domain-containing protein [Rivularia sp. UHCC 0363]